MMEPGTMMEHVTMKVQFIVDGARRCAGVRPRGGDGGGVGRTSFLQASKTSPMRWCPLPSSPATNTKRPGESASPSDSFLPCRLQSRLCRSRRRPSAAVSRRCSAEEESLGRGAGRVCGGVCAKTVLGRIWGYEPPAGPGCSPPAPRPRQQTKVRRRRLRAAGEGRWPHLEVVARAGGLRHAGARRCRAAVKLAALAAATLAHRCTVTPPVWLEHERPRRRRRWQGRGGCRGCGGGERRATGYKAAGAAGRALSGVTGRAAGGAATCSRCDCAWWRFL